MSLTFIVLVVVGAIVLAAVAIYLARGGANRRSKRLNPAPAGVTRAAAEAREGASTPIPDALDPMTLGKLRSGREGDRLSEDDIARQKMGAQRKRDTASKASRPGSYGVIPTFVASTTKLNLGRVLINPVR